MVDNTGNEVANYDYNPFGAVNTDGQLTAIGRENPFRFSSEYHDEETGLVYYNFRYYSPELGRWLSRDPIGEFAGKQKKFNLIYGFIENNSINKIDHLGKTVQDLFVKVVTGRLKRAVGISLDGSFVVESGLTGGIQAMFFPDTCEIGFYSIYNAPVGTLPEHMQDDNPTNVNNDEYGPFERFLLPVFRDMPWGLDVSVSLTGTRAIWNDSAPASAATWEGVFYGANGGVGIVVGGAFWDPNGKWIGIDGSISASMTFVSLKTNPQYYHLIKSFTIPKCLCYSLIIAIQ